MIPSAYFSRAVLWALLIALVGLATALEFTHARQVQAERLLVQNLTSQSGLGTPAGEDRAATTSRVRRLESTSQGLVAGVLIASVALLAAAAALLRQQGKGAAPGTELSATSEKELAALSRQLQHLTETEKAQLARSLHDELGGLLIAVKMDTSWLQKRWPNPTPDVQARWERVFKVLDDGVDFKRRVVEHLRPTLLDNMGLIAALRWVTHETCSRAGLDFTESYPEQEPALSEDVSILVFRLVQEALNNVVKHAKASDVRIEMTNEAAQLAVLIEDNGIGMGIVNGRPSTADSVLHGLAIMRLRVISLGGSLDVQSSAGGGTILRARLPLQRADQNPVIQLPTAEAREQAVRRASSAAR